MRSWHWLKYVVAFLAPAGTLIGMLYGGYLPLVPVIFAFLIVPFIELIIPPDQKNLSTAEAIFAAKDPVYDILLYLLLPLQFIILFFFLSSVKAGNDSFMELLGKTLSMGILCGIVGINVGHELGHRKSGFELVLANLFLLSSLYMHFFIEHNRGHHKNVGTHDDPASARFGESIYEFWVRSITGSYWSAWKIENERLKKNNLRPFSIKNAMIQIHIYQFLFLLLVFYFFGLRSLLFFVLVALIGILLLESVNYIEHYGLGRRLRSEGVFVKPLHCHSWNSDHVLSRVLLFELSRHSDHHYKASKKYQLLNHHDDSPQMPTGYAGMIVLALISPLWFVVMHPIIKRELKRFPDLVMAN